MTNDNKEPISVKHIMKENNMRQFEDMARKFFHNWQPHNPRDAEKFNAELFSLLRQVFMDATSEMTDLLANIISQIAPKGFDK